jgi:hypothetical protein
VTRIERFLALRSADRWLFLQAAMAVPFVRMALRVFGFRRCHAALSWLTPGRMPPASDPLALDDVARLARLVRAAARHGMLNRNCLTESLAMWWLLRRRGLDSDIRIGVRKEGGGLDAHAWVEWAGMSLDEHRELSRSFRPLVRPTAS